MNPGQRAYSGGLWAAIRCHWTRTSLTVLQLVFRFDRWHAAAPYCCRAYKQAVVQLANELNPTVAVELGCGLGDIISRIRAAECTGIDIDLRVIKAARFLHPKGRWIHGDGSCILGLVAAGPIDCLIMVNWIHALTGDELASLILPVLARVRYLIVDSIDPDAPMSYRSRHDFSFLSGRAHRVSVLRVAAEPRTFIVFKTQA